MRISTLNSITTKLRILLAFGLVSLLAGCGGGGGGSSPNQTPVNIGSSSSLGVVSSSSSISSFSVSSISSSSFNSSSSSSSSSISSSASSSSSSANLPTLSGDSVLFTSGGELMDTVTLPSPLSTVSDSLVHQPEVANDAAIGLYKSGNTFVITLGSGVSDCPNNGTITCPYFDRIKIASNGKISTDKWAYYPVQKKWVALSTQTISQRLNFASSDTTFDGASWSTASIALSPKSQTQAGEPWLYSYGNGNVEYQLKLTGSTTAGQAITGAPGKTYPSDAKSITLWFEQHNGVFYTLKNGGFWSSNRESSDDGKQYTNVAALRAAHIATSTPLCLESFNVSALIYFDSTMHAAGVSNVSGICNATIKSTDKITAVQSGVITLANRPVIAAQIPDDLFSSNTPAREKQILAIVGLNAVGGNAANGLAYLPGYTKTLTGYQNPAAFKAWLNTVTADTEAQTLP